MLKKKLRQRMLLFVLVFTCLLVPAAALANTPIDITDTGINFLTDPPTETTVYKAGEGTVTYEPAQNGQSAVITLENATINGCQSTDYQGQNPASAAILMSGNVIMVLQGENKITVKKNYAYGLFCLNGNLNVRGPGSLAIDMQVVLNGSSGIKVLCAKDATEDMGDFTLTGGNISLSLLPEDHSFSYCLSVNKDVTVEGGSLSIENGTYSIISIIGDIKIQNAAVSCKNFDEFGFRTDDGNIVIAGEDTELNIAALANEPYSIGICAEGQDGSSAISISGGTVDISAGQSGIYTASGGNIKISGGKVSAKAENTDAIISAAGLWATGKVDITGGTVYASGMANTGVGIYSDVSITVSGGDITAKGTSQAVSHVPDTVGYQNPVITAATDFEGTQTEDFFAGNLESYEYLHIVPGGGQYTIHYENGRATINAPQAAKVVVIFAAYNDSQLINLEVQEASLAAGENIITPEHFSPDEGKMKVMLWDSMDNMRPLCGAEIFGLSTQ